MNLEFPDQSSVSRPEEDIVEIDLIEVIYFIWDHLWQIVLCAFLGAFIFFGHDYLVFQPQYATTAKVYVPYASSELLYDETTIPSSDSLVADFRELLLTRPILEQVIENLNLGMDYQQLYSMVSISIGSGSRVLYITVTGEDPATIADIANQLAAMAQAEILPIINTQTPEIVESALVPEPQSRPSSIQKGVKGGILGGLLWCAALLVWYFWKKYGYLLKRPEKTAKS